MDQLITTAARALALGDPLAALNRVALREDAPALALRGIAMAQLGELERARQLLRQAGRSFGQKEVLARARCAVAEAEVAFAARDLSWPTRALAAAAEVLETTGDRANAAHARLLEARRLLLIGRLDDADAKLSGIELAALPPAQRALLELTIAGIAMRRIEARKARAALGRAEEAARWARIPALEAEVGLARDALDVPAARIVARGEERPLVLEEVEDLLPAPHLVIDACRNMLRRGSTQIPLASRPVLFALARTLGEAWPGDVPRDILLARAFGARFVDESHRARLRVEIGRLRRLLSGVANIEATGKGFILSPVGDIGIIVLARPVEEEHATLLALLTDGEAWSSSALALAMGASQRTIQRALEELAAEGKVTGIGRGRSQRWTTPPLPGFATALLLPAPFSGG
ncbi:helix-turn-helix domain-containing protein [Radicibacter daui]|uniref:helix-turn-helix domain-containing protein n=1 Tax=Radicibacter daui TaxID=3064829 RepID=UPI00404703F1